MQLKLLLAFFIPSYVLVASNEVELKNYGPYEAKWDEFNTCKGPKKGECGNITLSNKGDLHNVVFNMIFQKDCPLTEGRVAISSKTNRSANKLWNYSIGRPCDHFVLGPVFKNLFNMTRSCKITKGSYAAHINMYEKASTFLGPRFFYGVYAFKVTVYNKANNFLCVSAVMHVMKKAHT